jgi:hypothetical protein
MNKRKNMADSHTWHFFRAGGFDQVQPDSGADYLLAGVNKVSGMQL